MVGVAGLELTLNLSRKITRSPNTAGKTLAITLRSDTNALNILVSTQRPIGLSCVVYYDETWTRAEE